MALTLDGRSPAGRYARAPSDFYPTGEPLAEPLNQLEPLGKRVWEPACGDGRLARVLESQGIQVIASDLMAWGYGIEGRDFLRSRRLLAPVIVTNPPFSLWREFGEHALALGAAKVVMLGRTLLQEGSGIGTLFDRALVRVWQARRRVNLAPIGALDKGHNTKLAFAWYVLEPGKTADHWQVRGFTPRR
jgi:hypothetical protein